ncbi:unnamed protein product, partial [Tenebrio molitor]
FQVRLPSKRRSRVNFLFERVPSPVSVRLVRKVAKSSRSARMAGSRSNAFFSQRITRFSNVSLFDTFQ